MTEVKSTAGEVFDVTRLDDGQVRLALSLPAGGDVELIMAPESAQWLAWKLAGASRLPWPPPIRIVRKPS